jgi:hypothetical protein
MDATMTRKKRQDRAVKIEDDIVTMAHTMCSYRKTLMAQYLSDILRPVVERDFQAFTQELAGRAPDPKPGKPRR